MSITISNSPAFSPSKYHHHHSILTSNLSPRACSPLSRLSTSPFKKSGGGIVEDGPSTSASAPVKRKRPARLDIPVISNMGFGGMDTMRVGEEEVVEEERDGFYSVCCKKGRRVNLEDRFSAVLDVDCDPKQAFFGVFDGHGGAKAAEYAAKNLDKSITAEVVSCRDEDNIEDAVKRGYLKTDSNFLEQQLQGGSCCVTALITKGNLVVSNAGDCRAVMSRGGVAEALTTDHRPSRSDEKERVEANGGYIDCYNGVWRIQGSLAVSRGIGDRQLKQWVIAEPETTVVSIEPNNEFLILASDGLWDKVSNQEAVDAARPFCSGSNKLRLLAACKQLVDLAVSRGSLDDTTVMVIPLEQFMQ